MNEWYNLPWIDIVERLDSDEKRGLSLSQVNEIKEKSGINRIFNLDEMKKKSIFKKMFLVPWFIMLIVAAILMLFSEHFITGTILLILTFISDIIYYYDDLKKAKSIKQLEKIDEISAYVIRNEKMMKIPAEELVVGDIVYIEKGNSVPADIRIIECKNLKIKQTSVTGEIYEAEKYATKIEEKDISLVEMKNMLFKSSIVLEGDCTGIVIAIGVDTEVGRIVKKIFEEEERKEKYQSFFETSKKLIVVTSIFSAIFIVSLNITLGTSFKDIVSKTALMLAAFSPLLLIVILSSYLILVKKLFNKNGVQIKGLSSIEIASTIDVLFVEKIGFFTENEMSVKKIYTDGDVKDFSEDKFETTKNIDRIINIALLCNNNSKNNVEEKALIEFAKKAFLDKSSLDARYRRLFEVPFDIERGIKSTVNKVDKHYRAHVVGTLEKILEKCKFIMKNGIEIEITKEDIDNIKLADMEMSVECLTVSAFAYRNFNYAPSKDENIESYLVFVGLLGYKNALKPFAQSAYEEAVDKDLKIIITSEDSKLTALSVGNDMGLNLYPENVLCGVEIENMNDKALENFVERISIISRLSISDKLRVIKSLKIITSNILTIGNKLTDLPLFEVGRLKLAYGSNCSSTINAAADAFIEEENFEKVVFYIKESKPIYIKFLKFLKYATAITFCQGAYMLLYAMFNSLSLNAAFTTYCANLFFVFASFVFFSRRKYHYRFYVEPEDKIYFQKIIGTSLLLGTVGFVINLSLYNGGELRKFLVSILVLPLLEFIFVNRKFNLW